jgi:hypothetical protein
MARVYSTSFIDFVVTLGDDATYSITEGYLVVLRDATGVIDTPTGAGVQCDIYRDELVLLEWLAPASGHWTFQWHGRIVVPATSIITASVDTAGSSWSLSLSGYLLTTP